MTLSMKDRGTVPQREGGPVAMVTNNKTIRCGGCNQKKERRTNKIGKYKHT